MRKRGALENRDAVGNRQKHGRCNSIPFYSDYISIRAAGAGEYGKGSDIWRH
jgi:hypothetical protein